MKTFTTLIFACTFCSLLSCQDNMRELNKTEVIKMYQRHSGHNIKYADDFCVEKAHSLKAVYSIGWFAHDLGCSGNEILVAGEFGTIDELTIKGLQINGWENEGKRQQLCLDWARDVVLAWETPVYSSNEDFEVDSTPDFHEPKSEAIKGGWEVSLWVQRSGGMLKESNYYQLQVHYDRKGRITEQKTINSFTVTYE